MDSPNSPPASKSWPRWRTGLSLVPTQWPARDGIWSSLAAGPRCFGEGQRSGEAELMAVRIGEVEEALPPPGVRRGGVGLQARGDGPRVEGVHVRDVEDRPAPPRPAAIGGLLDQVQIAGARMQAGEGRLLAAMADGEAQGAIKTDGAGHVVRGQADGADALDTRGIVMAVRRRGWFRFPHRPPS